MDKLYVIKIGGEVIDSPTKLQIFLQQFSSIPGNKILVHGGGKLATDMAGQLGIPQQMLEGRRITDAETLKVVTMVYAGLVNKQIVAALQAKGDNALGMTGADGNLVLAHKREAKTDYGFVGDVDEVNVRLLKSLLMQDIVPVLAPLTHDGKGQLLNTNADTIAKTIAEAMSQQFDVHLVYSFDKPGVLRNADDDDTVISSLTHREYTKLREEGKIFAGMIPKLDNAFEAVSAGIKKLTIGRAAELHDIINGRAGTSVTND